MVVSWWGGIVTFIIMLSFSFSGFKKSTKQVNLLKSDLGDYFLNSFTGVFSSLLDV
jgi:hypothetical protein